MSYNKNGLEVNLNFDYSIKEKDLLDIPEKIVIQNISSINFLQIPKKKIQFEKYSYNFPIIYKKKQYEQFYVINKISKLNFKPKEIKEIKTNNEVKILEIIKINDINVLGLEKKIIPKIFLGLKKENENDILISGIIKEIKNEIINSINDFIIYGKEKGKKFDIIDVENKVNKHSFLLLNKGFFLLN